MVFGWLFKKRKDEILPEARIEWEPSGNGMVKNILNVYPEDYVICSSFSVAGITFRFVDAANFSNSQNLSVELEREPTNKHDKHAIGVFGICQRGRYFIGYVPKEITAQVARSGMFDVLLPRLVRIYTGPQAPDGQFDHPYLEIQMQLFCPKGRKTEFEQAAKVSRKRKPTS